MYDNFLDQLNDEQRLAVVHKNGPAVVYAGAGSGKTRVICSRIVWLISTQSVHPNSIVAMTFTNKAAKEMKERVYQAIGEQQARSVTVSTFHAFCAKFLRIYAEEIGYNKSFSIYDDGDQKKVLKEILRDLKISDEILSVNLVKSKIEKIKNAGINPEKYLEKINEDFSNKNKEKSFFYLKEKEINEVVYKVYFLYQERMRKINAMDFNDILLNFYELLQEKKHVLNQLQYRFLYFMVDEFQDTNPIQFQILSQLSSLYHNIFIVGDDDQSIYSWRGADPAFILNFDKIYKDSTIYKLQENYRSTDCILKGASSLIKNNVNRVEKNLYTRKFDGKKIKIKSFSDSHAEAHFIANEIYLMMEKNKKLSGIGILYRTNAQSRALEDELRRRMIPYVIYGSVRFYERAEIKTLLCYLQLLVNPHDDICFEKVMSVPRRGFGEKALERIKEIAANSGSSLLRVAQQISLNLLNFETKKSSSILKDFVLLYQKWTAFIETQSPLKDIIDLIVKDINLEEYLKHNYPDDFDERWLNILELKSAISEYEILREIKNESSGSEKLSLFLENVLLSVEPNAVNVRKGDADAVTLMTIHSAKGLEFNDVFISGLEEGFLPHQNSLNEPEGLEEERRLMYVAMTRAQDSLVLTYSRRNRYKEFLPVQPSRFLSEIPDEFLENETGSSLNCEIKEVVKSVNLGARVFHQIFGEGIIVDIEKGLYEERFRVRFLKKQFGEKLLLKRYLSLLT